MSETNRVLNFSEFDKKYSDEASHDIAASYSEFSNSSDNFKDGFDEDTYEEGQPGPKRPISNDMEETPSDPVGFNTKEPEDLQAPSEEIEDEDVEEIEDEDVEEIEDEDESEEWNKEEYGNPEGDAEEEDEDEEDEDEEEETNESRNVSILESFEEYVSKSQPRSNYDSILDTIELEDDDEEDHGNCIVICQSCGSEKEIEPGQFPFGKNNEDDPNSWWQGAKMGMQCGCNM